jgi:hypothetical protein
MDLKTGCERSDDQYGMCKECLRGPSGGRDCTCDGFDETREVGYYYVELPWGKTIVAYWGRCGSGRNAWWLAGHPDGHETEYFAAIGNPVLLNE